MIILLPTGVVKAWHTPVVTTRRKHPRKLTKSGKPKVSSKRDYQPRVMLALLMIARALARKQRARLCVCIEKQWSRPTDSKSAIESMAAGYAVWMTLIKLLKLYYIEVSPTAWKPVYLPKGAAKEESRKLCRRLYPGLKLPLAKDEAIAEATMIADFVRRRDANEPYPRKRPVVRRKKTTKSEEADRPRTRQRLPVREGTTRKRRKSVMIR